MACVGRPSVTIQRPRAGAAQWRPMKAAWFDALIFDPILGAKIAYLLRKPCRRSWAI